VFPPFPLAQLNKNPVTKGGSRPGRSGGAPVVFSAQGDLAAGKQVTLNAQTLQSGFRTPYFIDEIRVAAYTTSHTVDEGRGVQALNDAIRIKFQTGSHAFSQDFVPVGNMYPAFSNNDYGNYALSDTTFTEYMSGRWILPRPLFMPAGDVVLANVELNDRTGIIAATYGTATAVRVTVTYVGRLIAQGFKESEPRYIPWLAWWTKAMSDSYAESQTRLRNPFFVPAHVQRFTMRTFIYDTSAATPLYSESDKEGMYARSAGYHAIRIDDSRGYAIVPKFAAVGSVFDGTRRAWTFGRELGPREQFNMQMRTEGTEPVNTDYFTNVGLVGYREEAL
jgi:hypothetical protein